MNLGRALVGIGCIPALALFVPGCATINSARSPEANAPIRSVDFGNAPELRELAEHARRFGNETYPKVCALLLNEGAKPPPQFDLVLRPRKSQHLGETQIHTGRIYIDPNPLTTNANSHEVFDKVFTHEMAHLAVHSRHWILNLLTSDTLAERYWGESIADYAAYKIVGTNGWGCPECNADNPHYTSGYECGSAFLLFLEAASGTNLVKQLVAELRRRSYSDQFVLQTTGKSVETLWDEFQSTQAFRPGAAESLRIQQALGFKPGQPPRDAIARLTRYIERTTGDPAASVLNLRYDPDHPPPITVFIELYLYNTQPGGSPENAVLELRNNTRLPGLAGGETGFPISVHDYDELVEQNYPKSKTVLFHKEGSSSIYHYTMALGSPESGWKLVKAWRAAPNGEVIEEYPVP